MTGSSCFVTGRLWSLSSSSKAKAPESSVHHGCIIHLGVSFFVSSLSCCCCCSIVLANAILHLLLRQLLVPVASPRGRHWENILLHPRRPPPTRSLLVGSFHAGVAVAARWPVIVPVPFVPSTSASSFDLQTILYVFLFVLVSKFTCQPHVTHLPLLG